MRAAIVSGFVLAILYCSTLAVADEKYDAQWIWYDAGNPASHAAAGKVWFRRELRANEPSTGAARVLCDDRFTFWVNGKKVGQGNRGKLYRFNLNGIVERGPNVFAVEAENLGGKAGLFIDGEIRSQGGHLVSFDTGSDWVATTTNSIGDAWRQPKFDQRSWKAVKNLGLHEKSPWKEIVLKDSYLDRYDVPEGFELVRIGEPKLVGSLVAMTWGNRGRLLVSRERGPIENVIDDNNDGIYDRVVDYTRDVKNCQGLCMVADDLYAVGSGPKGVGIYRLPDKNQDDKADSVELVVKARGNMGDHGPHDVVFGPDGWLYYNCGNHSWIKEQPESTSAVRNYEEDYLLVPKFEDAGGHAAGIKAPGGTIWRFTPDGKHWWCETNGFRNEYDLAFNSAGDLFSFDSDMEWDVGAYWYRPIRVTHCTAGAEFGWRSGAAKWPAFYFDSLPGTVDIGRGSPTGVVFYEHTQLPERLRGAMLLCDWSMGRILAAHLTKAGATYHGTFETILSGNPLNVADVEVDRDGSIVFVTGGRGTEGGIYRLRFKGAASQPAAATTVAELLTLPQFESAWAREIAARVKSTSGAEWVTHLAAAARSGDPAAQIRALTLLNQLGPKPELDLLLDVSASKDATVRAFATHLLGFQNGEKVREALVRLLSDSDATVRRRACEAFVSSGIEPPLDGIFAAIGSQDRFLRFSARLALERIPRDKWYRQAVASKNPHTVTEALLAGYRLDRRGAAAAILEKTTQLLGPTSPALSLELKLTALRLTQLALLQGVRNNSSAQIGRTLLAAFPTGQPEYDAESARILAVLNVEGAAPKILRLVETAKTHGEQLHYALTLRYLNAGWTFDLKRRLMDWYEGTRGWEGGNSLTGYVSNIVGAITEKFTPEDRKYFVLQWAKRPAGVALIVRVSQPEQIASFEKIVSDLLEESGKKARPGQEDLIAAAIQSLGKSTSQSARSILRRLYEQFPDRRDVIARAIADHPVPEDFPVLVRTLQFADETTAQLCLDALGQLDRRPENADGYRTVIQAALKLGKNGGRGAVALLKTWTAADHNSGRDFDQAVAFYQKWYGKKFPSAPLPELSQAESARSKYSFGQLSALAARDPNGNAQRGRLIFTKAKCVKCHRFQNEGESVGPDLTSVRRRFQRKEIVESIAYPSQVISDQYRMVQVVTTKGQIYAGMPIPGVSNTGKTVLLLSDTTKLEIPRDRIDETLPSKISVMPAGLLDALTPDEVADLFAFLETSKFNAPVAQAAGK